LAAPESSESLAATTAGAGTSASATSDRPRSRHRRATIQDVADRAGVAPSTVSAYINGTAPVGRGAATRITEAIDTLEYSPNPIARSLARGLAEPEAIYVLVRTVSDGVEVVAAFRRESDAATAVASEGRERIELIRTLLE
jgi:transcriptional regulator with XRE-family HTH domain